jgi:flagellin
MTRINTNVASLLGQRVLGQNNNALNSSLERLSTGLRINRGKDDPAGLIASENLRAEKTAVAKAISNAQRADQVVNIAEGGLDEISSLLNELQGLVTETANTSGLSTEEKEANQLQIDSILQTIDRVAAATSFQGTRLLNGNLEYATTNVHANVNSYQVNGAKLDFNGTRGVDVLVTGSAQLGGYYLSFGADNLNLGGAGASDGAGNQFVIEIAGNEGSRELSFASGTTIQSVVAAINSFTDVTGVTSTISGTDGLRIDSAEYGSNEFVSLKVVDDGAIGTGSSIGIYEFLAADTGTADTGALTTFAAANNPLKDNGQDVSATINGIVATTSGTAVRINTDFLDVKVDLETAGSGTHAQALGALAAFEISGGGADFQLAGKVDIAGKVSLGIQNVAVRALGQSDLTVSGSTDTFFLAHIGSGKDLNLVDGDTTAAQRVIEESIQEVSSLRGRLGAFQKNTVGATIRSLGVSLENTTAAESVVRDADFASETAGLTRSQILVSSATNILGIANNQPQNALQLLG